MQKRGKLMALALTTAIALVIPVTVEAQQSPASQATATFDYTQKMHPIGYSARQIPLANAEPGAGSFNSDLAFWGTTAVQGTYAGFRLVDVTEPGEPVEIVN